MSYKQTKNAAEEHEILSADDEKLRQMLGGLKKVNAPANFDFQIKARIANAEQVNSPRPFLFPALRYVLPLSLVVLIAGFILFNFSFITGNQGDQFAEIKPAVRNEIESISNSIISKPAIIDQAVAAEPVNKNLEIKTLHPEVAKSNSKTAVNKPNYINIKQSTNTYSNKNEEALKNSAGGSQDRAQKEVEVITQNNSNRNSNQIRQTIAPQNKISLQDVLMEIGIEANYDEKNWKILSIKENSAAKRAGLQAGDVIEAIDDKKPSSDDVYLQKFSGKVFRVLRGGKQVVIDLTAKQ